MREDAVGAGSGELLETTIPLDPRGPSPSWHAAETIDGSGIIFTELVDYSADPPATSIRAFALGDAGGDGEQTIAAYRDGRVATPLPRAQGETLWLKLSEWNAAGTAVANAELHAITREPPETP